MRLAEQSALATSVNGVAESKQMSVNLDGRMLRNLVSGMYSRKAEAVIRELVANGIDAHVVAKNSTDDVLLQLPTVLQDEFSIRDYGDGMPHDFILNNYSTLGFSSKTRTNAATGMFGLGSKTPYAVVDRFSVVTFIDGEERSYLCHYDDEGMPSVSFLSARKTQERNGTKIAFKTPRAMQQEFMAALERIAISFAEYKVKVIGARADWMPTFTKLVPGVYLFDSRSHSRDERVLVRQGAAIYPLNIAAVPLLEDAHRNPVSIPGLLRPMAVATVLRKYFDRNRHRYTGAAQSDFGIMIDISIGTADVTTSREEMEYTPKTIKSLTEKLTLIAASILKEEQRLLGGAKTYRELYENLSKTILSKSYDYNKASFTALDQTVDILSGHIQQHASKSISSFDPKKDTPISNSPICFSGLTSGTWGEIQRGGRPLIADGTQWRFDAAFTGYVTSVPPNFPIVFLKTASQQIKGNDLLRAQQYVHEAPKDLHVRFIVIGAGVWDKVEAYAKYLGTWVYETIDLSTIKLDVDKYGPTAKKVVTERNMRDENEFDVLNVGEVRSSSYTFAEPNVVVDFTEDIYYAVRVPDQRSQVFLQAEKEDAKPVTQVSGPLTLTIPQRVELTSLQYVFENHPHAKTHKFVILNYKQCKPEVLAKFKSAKPFSEALKITFTTNVQAQKEAMKYAPIFRRQSLSYGTLNGLISEFINRGEDLIKGRHVIIAEQIKAVITALIAPKALKKLCAVVVTQQATAAGHTLGLNALARTYAQNNFMPNYNLRSFVTSNLTMPPVSAQETAFNKWLADTFPVGVDSSLLQYGDRPNIAQYLRALDYFIWSIKTYHKDEVLANNLNEIDEALLTVAYAKLDSLTSGLSALINQKTLNKQKDVAAA
jgi:hypothetical protein